MEPDDETAICWRPNTWDCACGLCDGEKLCPFDHSYN